MASRGRTVVRRSPRDKARLLARLVIVVLAVGVLFVGVLVAVEEGLRAQRPSGAAGAAGSPGSVATPRGPAPVELPDGPIDYVAMGDSFAAGPGLLPQRTDPVACDRASDNYPAHLAQWLEVATYRDVSCTGATTDQVASTQRRPGGTDVAPQIGALDADTDLVTVTLGGNNDLAFQRMIEICARPETEGDEPCDLVVEQQPGSPLKVVTSLADRTVEALYRIRSVAPDAVVVVVGYPRSFPDAATCAELGFAPSESAYAHRLVEAIDDALAEAAQRAGVLFVDLREPSAGHDICAAEPWVAGQALLRGAVRPWHPYVEGMRGAAAAVLAQLTGRTAPEGEGPVEVPPGALVLNR